MVSQMEVLNAIEAEISSYSKYVKAGAEIRMLRPLHLPTVFLAEVVTKEDTM